MVGNSVSEIVTLVSTHTRDRVPLSNGGYREIPGGPAHYIGTSLERLGRPYRLVTGSPALVDVLPLPDGQQYLIPALPRIHLPERFTDAAVILSPIMQEIDGHALPDCDGILIVDLQGFVRQPMRPTDEDSGPYDVRSLLQRTDVVKASERELAKLTPESRCTLDHLTLLLTRGQRGTLVCSGGREELVAADAVDIAETIGAGDTFLAAYTDAILKGADAFEAARLASKFTSTVLRERSSWL
jgi:sugar/nucleoside kinase (ribokinase family)